MSNKLNTIKKLWKRDKYQIVISLYNHIVHSGITNILSDEMYLKLTYRVRFREKLNLKQPVTFNQKLQWLKLNDRKDRYTQMVDKVEVKKYVGGIIGEEYLIPTLGVWDCFDDIDFDKLPDQFVLKCNHDSGSVVICKEKSVFDKRKARHKLMKGIRTDAFYWGREWPYKEVKKKILAEKYIEDNQSELNDYKFMCFNGKVRCSFVCSERFSQDGLKVTFFDRDWNVMPFERHYPKSSVPIEKPLNYEKMIGLAEQLSKDIPFVRVDFYEASGKIYFGELTFYPGSGFEEFTPYKWDVTLGNWISLPDEV